MTYFTNKKPHFIDLAVSLLLTLSILSGLRAQSPDTWEQKPDLGFNAPNGPTARYAAVGFSIGSKGYIGTGTEGRGGKKDFWEYDPGTDSWSQKADFAGEGRYSAVGFSIGSKGYIGTGSTGGGFTKDFWEYDPVGNNWTQKADFGGGVRDRAVGFSIGSKGYIGTGMSNTGSKKDFWEYDPGTDSWTKKADFGDGVRYYAVGFSIGSKGYIATGFDVSFNFKKDFWEYDPGTDSWKKKANFDGVGRIAAVGFNIGGKGYIGMGLDASNVNKKDFWEYNPGTDSWAQKADFAGGEGYSCAGFGIGSKGYLGMGNYNTGLNSNFWEYDVASNIWTKKADLPGGAASRISAVGFSIGSKGYLGTGTNANDNPTDDFWEYDPGSNSWTQKADFGGGERDYTVGFSIGGKGYIGTGQDASNVNKNDFWEYDPGSNSWTKKADFSGGGRLNAVGFSIGSKGYIGTGYDENYNLKNDFWEYDPRTDSWTNKADFGGTRRSTAVGFSIGSKGYLGTGFDENYNIKNDFWEYDPGSNSWTKKADFAGGERYFAVGFSIGSKGYLSTGSGVSTYKNDLWAYSPSCDNPTAALSGGGTVCTGAPLPNVSIAFTGAAPWSVTYSNGTTLTTVNNITSSPYVITGAAAGTYSVTAVSNAGCAGTPLAATVKVILITKPTITLSVNGQILNEGNTQTLCDTDTNPVNPLQFTGSCTAGNLVWRVQAGNGPWSDWSPTVPGSQPSSNSAYKYQAACDAACPSTYTDPIDLTINYRASTPQNVSLVADGTPVAAGESKTICNLEGNVITFSATCATGEIRLYSVDGSDYSTIVPSQIVDNNFHNYRVRCRKADNTPSCVETESAAMSLKITTAGPAPTVSLSPTSGCGTPTNFSGLANCGNLTTVWYNAITNAALPNLPTVTPTETTSYYARCQGEAGCQSEKSNTVTFTLVPVNNAPIITVSSELVCTGTSVTVSANCPAGSQAEWSTGVSGNSFQVAFSNVTKATYTAKCVAANGCQSPVSAAKSVSWKAFELTFINVGQSKSATKTNDKAAWASQFITPDAGPSLDYSTEANPTLYFSENVNKTAPRFWTIHVDACALGTDGSLTFNMLSTPELGVVRSYNTHENNAPYFMYANRAGFTELYAQNHPAYGFFTDNGNGGNVYDEGLPKGLYKLGVRYWDQKGQGSIYPSTRQPAGNVLAYQEYWFRIQSKDGIGAGNARVAATTDNGTFAQVMPNPVAETLHLKVNEAKDQKVNITLLDAAGRTLLKRAFVPETNQHQEEFEVSHLSNGIYFMVINTAKKQTTLKIIKADF